MLKNNTGDICAAAAGHLIGFGVVGRGGGTALFFGCNGGVGASA